MNITLDASHVLKELNALNEKGKKVDEYTVKDMKRRIPGAVSTAVSKVYAINKNRVAACSSYYHDKTGRGRNSGKASVKTKFMGKTISTLAFVFTGKKDAEWKSLPKKPPKARVTSKQKGRGGRAVRKPYVVTVETYRGKPQAIKGKNGHRVYAIDGRNRAFVVGRSNKPMIHASSSVPQAIMNEKSQKIWRPKLNSELEKRFFHHFNRLMKK